VQLKGKISQTKMTNQKGSRNVRDVSENKRKNLVFQKKERDNNRRINIELNLHIYRNKYQRSKTNSDKINKKQSMREKINNHHLQQNLESVDFTKKNRNDRRRTEKNKYVSVHLQRSITIGHNHLSDVKNRC
jgi:LAS superfamily LD-carboxypeptidase LdcB